MSVWKTSRSEIIARQRCPRMGYYSRFFNGTGIEPIRRGLPLVFGSAFHVGAEHLLRGDVEQAVSPAQLHLDLAFSVESVDLEQADTVYALAEQKAIVEGLLRGWWAKDGERFLRDFEVIEIEREGEAELAPGMVLQFRPDALVREKQSGDYYIVSWKTASTFGAYTVNTAKTDMQSMSEAWGVEQTIKDYHYTREIDAYGDQVVAESDVRVEGILYIFAIKGQRKLDEYSGQWRQTSPLAYGWMKLGSTPDDTEWAHRYAWTTEEMNDRTGKLKGTKLGQGWKLVPVWESYPGGVKQWIDDLANQRIAPRHINALEAIFPQSMPVSRRADEIADWREQTVGQEFKLREAVEMVEFAPDTETIHAVLNVHFPQHTHSCYSFARPCDFFQACWTPAVKADPLGSQLYQIRTANHPGDGGDDGE